MTYGKRVVSYMAKMPDLIEFADEDGKLYGDMEPLVLDKGMKLYLAMVCIKQKQSLETVMIRIIRRAASSVVK